MNSSGLLHDVKSKPIVLLAAIALHFILIVMLGVNLSNSEVHKPASADKKIVKAVVVDAAKIDAEAKKHKQKKENKKKKEQAEKKKIKQQQDDDKKKLEAEKKRLESVKKKQETEKKRLADLKKKNLAEKNRIEKEKKKAEADRKQAEIKKAEAEKRKQEEIKKVEAEKRKQEDAKRKRDEENRRKAEAAELQRQLADEERIEAEALQAKEKNIRLQSLRSQYVRLIEQKVERNWLRPTTSTANMSCEVIVTQTSLGDVIDVSLGKCVNDLAFQPVNRKSGEKSIAFAAAARSKGV